MTNVRWLDRGNRRSRVLASLLAMLMVLAACGGEDDVAPETEPEEPEAEEPEAEEPEPDEPEAEEPEAEEPEAGGEFPNVVDGVLQPLPDGFPSGPITLTHGWEPGSDDDVFNQFLVQAAQDYSPVPLTTATHQQGQAVRAWGLLETMEDLPDAQEGYVMGITSVFGTTTRAFTTEGELADNDFVDMAEAFNWVARMTFAPYSFLAPKDGEFETIQDLEEAMQEREIVISSSSPGGGITNSTYVWAAEAGNLPFTYLPTDSPTEARQVLLGGGSDAATSRTEPGLGDEFNFLMITGDERLAAFPDVPAAAEFGYDIPSGTDRAYFVRPEVSEERREWLFELLRLASEDEDYLEQFAELEDTTILHGDDVQERVKQTVRTFIPVLLEQELVVRDLESTCRAIEWAEGSYEEC